MNVVLDWVQISVTLPFRIYVNEDTGEQENIPFVPVINGDIYTVQKREQGSQYFRDVYDINLLDGSDLAILETSPRVDFIDDSIGILKIANRVLYSENYFKVIESLLKDLELSFNHFTRIDYAIDLKQLKTGSCEAFIQSVASGEIVVKGNSKKTFFNKKEKKVDVVECELSESRYHYKGKKVNAMTLGSRQSSSMLCLYNKSLELRQKKDKPWIRQLWTESGLKYDSYDVWRLEISIKKMKRTFVAPCERFELGFDNFNLINPCNLKQIMQCLIDYKFQCAYPTAKQFCRMERIDVLDKLTTGLFLSSISRLKQSTTIVKHRVKKLIESALQYRQVPDTYRRCNSLLLHVKDIVYDYDLWNWYLKQGWGKIESLMVRLE